MTLSHLFTHHCTCRGQVDHFVQLPTDQSLGSYERNVAMIEARELDILVFPELGMHPPTYALAFRRMAPVQVRCLVPARPLLPLSACPHLSLSLSIYVFSRAVDETVVHMYMS